MPVLYFEQFEEGQVLEHPWTRTVTQTDNVLFSSMTMNPAKLHIDAACSATTGFGQPIINSLAPSNS